ncbi:SDR family NAD(P)-dependent oxidoreductase [Demequina sp. TTPB684]|uniref:SDR family NAD(P)-dependent oxidoreductase n=1 Tax=unclassified Demequina TaxID=2620311 RepID=UPI001CF36DF3|nr:MULTISPECIES: SDR family NAD(P)-dependent oxidoreductase [unclassified Demequina]MCB2411742.1 SDR family NAD(P)-dependent oxidoreductase [Demequina sp. TTPB684]UPU87605.1 SDR family NAD(P)-dependent oxidoreductase [Demequina sp. TMPB413]
MARIFITGSTRGIGAETARQLIDLGHEVVVHARNAAREDDAAKAVPGAAGIVTGELDSLASTAALAASASAQGPYDVIIHNAGVGGGLAGRELTSDGFERIFHTNVIAPYMLTGLMVLPRRIVYLTSGLEANGTWAPEDLQWTQREWRGMQAYSDSKLHDLMLALEVAARYRHVISNAVDPGWIKTEMGGPQAPDPVELGAETQVWLATSDDAEATLSGRYLKRRQELAPNPIALDAPSRTALIDELERLTEVSLPSREQ